MTATEVSLDLEQRAVVDHPPGGGSLAVTGRAGSGKTVALLRRAERLAGDEPGVLVTTPVRAALAALLERGAEGVAVRALEDVAAEILSHAAEDGRRHEFVDDARAAALFESLTADLFALEWTEFAAADLDPEIAGLRSPVRFAASAFRLLLKLRAAGMSPEVFKAAALRGAVDFYATPPNLATARLIEITPAKYRDSLRADAAELARQRLRENDLAKILARLYAAYVEASNARGILSGADAIVEATRVLNERPAARERARARYRAILVDDAQELTAAQLTLLESLAGPGGTGLTFAGDGNQRIRGFAGARLRALEVAAQTIALQGTYRSPPALATVAEALLPPAPGPARTAPRLESVELYRADSQRNEARYVADEVARAIAAGTPPQRIAIVVRNLGCAHPYVNALLARDIPTDVTGSASLYAYPAVLDALAALWSAVDPFRHEYLLRNLEAPWLRLSDASIAALCAEPPTPQPLLIALPPDAEDEEIEPRIDRSRELRLALNVTRGDVDAQLDGDARERVAAFRAARDRWESLGRTLDLPALARTILAETALAVPARSARERFDGALVRRLIAEVDAFAEREPLATLDGFLAHAERMARADASLLAVAPEDPGAVTVRDVETLTGTQFDVVFLADVRAGSWPAYYVPDAFLFTPKWGMIPKDNVGDARAARTAKFTWAFGTQRFRESYNDEGRRAFYLAATRARKRLFVTAWGKPTKGLNTPELLAELEARRP